MIDIWVVCKGISFEGVNDILGAYRSEVDAINEAERLRLELKKDEKDDYFFIEVFKVGLV